jgi:YHS domain-containing protein
MFDNLRKGDQPMTTTVHDPVCHMDIDPATAAGTSEYKDQTYYFGSLGCKKAFDKEPEKYLSKTNQSGSQHSF